MKTKKRRIFENQISNEYAVCVTEKDDWGNRMDRVITTGSKEYCENWIEDYCRQYSWNRGMHYIKPVTEVDNQQFKEDYFGKNNSEDDFADLENMLDNVGVSVNRRDVFGENKDKKNMKKNTIRLTESELKNIIFESVKKTLKESNYNNPQDPVSLLTDIIGRYATKEDRNDYEIQGQSGRYYRFIINRDYVTVMWASEPYEWDGGEEFMLRLNEPFVKSLIYYIIDSAKL